MDLAERRVVGKAGVPPSLRADLPAGGGRVGSRLAGDMVRDPPP